MPTEGDWDYTVSNNTATTTNYRGTGTYITTPYTLGGYPVVTIGEGTFYQKLTVLSVNISYGVTLIDELAFNDCIYMTTVSLPSTLITIAYGGFYNCTGLITVYNYSNVQTVGEVAFASCTSLQNITFNDGLLTIGQRAFMYCSSLQTFSMPNSVNSLSTGYTFYGCTRLSSVNISTGLSSLPAGVFYGVGALHDGPFTITIPPNITTIGDNAFDSTGISSIVIPNTVTSLGSYCFRSNTNLSSVSIGTGISSIPANTFNNCDSLYSISIPGNITSIGTNALSSCYNLCTINFLGNTPSVGDDWILDSCVFNRDIRGHAYSWSNFPTPGNYFPAGEPDLNDRLIMGRYLDSPPIMVYDGSQWNSVDLAIYDSSEWTYDKHRYFWNGIFWIAF